MERTGSRDPFYFLLALAFLVIAVAGFSTTFFVPLARDTFSVPSWLQASSSRGSQSGCTRPNAIWPPPARTGHSAVS